MKKLDKINVEILNILQKDADIGMEKLAKKVHLSKVPCWKRVKYLKEEKYIKNIVAVLDKKKFNLNIEVFIEIETTKHNSTWLTDFSDIILSDNSVIGFYRTTGSIDYIVHTAHKDTTEYDTFYKKITQIDGISKVSGTIVMENIKPDTGITISTDM